MSENPTSDRPNRPFTPAEVAELDRRAEVLLTVRDVVVIVSDDRGTSVDAVLGGVVYRTPVPISARAAGAYLRLLVPDLFRRPETGRGVADFDDETRRGVTDFDGETGNAVADFEGEDGADR